MNALHAQTLQSFSGRLQWLFGLRAAVRLATVWLFLWGVTVLVARISGWGEIAWLALGGLGIIPVIFIAAWQARRQLPAFGKLRALYDRWNACGGLIMAEEAADMAAWQGQLPAAAAPQLRWRSGRAMVLLSLAALFAAITLWLPESLANFSIHHPLEIGQAVEQLQAEVKLLQQEKILDDPKAADLQKQLAHLQKDSSSFDPDKTWEALDHIQEANSAAAQQAAEEALAKTESLTQAETLAKAMEQAADAGMNEATAAQAAQDLAAMLNAAKLEEGVLNGKIPPELLSGLNGLNPEQMKKLAQALAAAKKSLALTAGNLANLKMIDAATLAKLQAAGHTPDYAGLADYLSQCQGGECDQLFSWLRHPGKGGSGGGPEADMTWNDGASEKDLKFQAHALPPAAQLSDAQLVGVSQAAPQLSGNQTVAEHGALANAAGAGGSAQTQLILPEQRQAVRNFFKRDP
jgi:hypothetical protein